MDSGSQDTYTRVISLGGLRRRNIPYIVVWIAYYAWVITFTTWWTSSPTSDLVFNAELRSLLHIVNLLSSALFIFFIRKEWFVRTARIGAAVIISGMFLFMFFYQNTILAAAVIVLIGLSLGLVNTSILMPFVFVLNNTEKFYAVVGSYLLINSLSILQESIARTFLQSRTGILLSCLFLLFSLLPLLFFKQESIKSVPVPPAVSNPKIKPQVYLTLFFNCVFAILCKGAGKGLLNNTAAVAAAPVMYWYCFGGLAGCFLYMLLYGLTSKSIHLSWNLTFGCLAMGLFCNAFSEQSQAFALVFAFLLGIGSTIGMMNMYYILGVIGNKYNSMLYLRLSLLFIGICGGVSGVVIGNLIDYLNNFYLSLTASVFSAAVMLVFLILSPVLAQLYYQDGWARDSEKAEAGNKLSDHIQKFNLSRREAEVCELLLQGYTLRQTASILSIAYPTANTYCTALYRKLSINSRTELLILLGGHAANDD